MFPLLFLGNDWADCVEIWYPLRNPLVTAYAVVTDGESRHVCTYTPRFCIFFYYKFSPNLLNGRFDETRARSKQSL